ncbi:transposase [Ideonella oryzae]|uniref:transposase n=1 Tax=Ideonella oryzae TaxID=2937441 RepID=UPI003F491634
MAHSKTMKFRGAGGFSFPKRAKKKCKEIFLEEINRVVLWAAQVGLIQPHARGTHQALGGRPPSAVETMLCIHCLQLWWSLSDPSMEEELQERPPDRECTTAG